MLRITAMNRNNPIVSKNYESLILSLKKLRSFSLANFINSILCSQNSTASFSQVIALSKSTTTNILMNELRSFHRLSISIPTPALPETWSDFLSPSKFWFDLSCVGNFPCDKKFFVETIVEFDADEVDQIHVKLHLAMRSLIMFGFSMILCGDAVFSARVAARLEHLNFELSARGTWLELSFELEEKSCCRSCCKCKFLLSVKWNDNHWIGIKQFFTARGFWLLRRPEIIQH